MSVGSTLLGFGVQRVGNLFVIGYSRLVRDAVFQGRVRV